MNLHFNARQLNQTKSKEKITKKDLINNYQTIVLKQFYQRLAKRQSKNIKALLLDDEQARESPEKPQMAHGNMNESEFSDDRLQDKPILLPNLQTKPTISLRDKLILNDNIFIHEKIAIKKSEVTFTKKFSLQEAQKKQTSSYFHPFGSLSSKKITDMEIIEINSIKQKSNCDIFIPKGQLKRHKSNEKINVKSHNQIIVYPTDEKKSPLKLETDKMTMDKNSFRQIFHQKSRIQKIIDHYKAIKQKRDKNELSIMDRHMINSIENRQKIKIEGQQTIYCEKKDPKRMKKQKSITGIPKIKYINWKIKELPFTDITKSEVVRLLSFYLFTKEAVPAQSGHYKVYVGDGNNSQLVVRLLKNRGWWLPTEDINEANLIWTQLPQEQQMKRLPNHQHIVLTSNTKDYLLLCDNEFADKAKIDKFLKYKQNPFFNACEKLLYGPIYNKFMLQFISKFMDNQYLRSYSVLKDQVSRFYSNKQLLKVQSKTLTIVNHCEYSNQIGDKKQLFYHIEKYCEINSIDKSTMIPKTIHINQTDIQRLKASNNQSEIHQHLKDFQVQQTLYILKPGEESNRGHGITVHQSKQSLISHISQSLITFPQNKTYIVQEYIDPLLYEGRKFDIRVWALYSNNRLWFYREGYVRTSCKQYSTKNMNKFIHLTNDAVQKYSDEYGKYQPANKVSFNDLDKYLKRFYNYQNFYSQMYNNIKSLTTQLFQVGNLIIGKSCHQFQLFGLDFLIDKNFKVWLIECNTNPSIQICCSLLNRLVPNMIENLLNIAVDPVFPAVERKAFKEDFEWSPQRFNFELLLDGTLETKYLETIDSQDREYLNTLANINSHKLKSYKSATDQPEEHTGDPLASH